MPPMKERENIQPTVAGDAELAAGWVGLLSPPGSELPLNTMVGLTLRQCVRTALPTRWPRDGALTVQPKQHGGISRCPQDAPRIHVQRTMVGQLATRLMNRVNKRVLGHASTRSHDRKRIPAAVFLHNSPGRWHMHGILGLPASMSAHEFREILVHAGSKEPFVYEVIQVEPLRSPEAAFRYCMNRRKSLDGDALIYFSAPS